MKSIIFQSTRWAKALAVSFSLALLMAVASPVLGQQDIQNSPRLMAQAKHRNWSCRC